MSGWGNYQQKKNRNKKQVDEDKLFSFHSPWGGCQNIYPFAAFSTHTKRERERERERERDQSNKNEVDEEAFLCFSFFSIWSKFFGETDVFYGKAIVNVLPKWNFKQGKWRGGTIKAKSGGSFEPLSLKETKLL